MVAHSRKGDDTKPRQWLRAGALRPALLVALAGGCWALTRNRPFSGGRRFAALLAGVIVLVLLATIPYLGGLIVFLAMLLGLGSLWLWGTGRARRGGATA